MRVDLLFLHEVFRVDFDHQSLFGDQVQTVVEWFLIPVRLQVEAFAFVPVHVYLVHVPDNVDSACLDHSPCGTEIVGDQLADISVVVGVDRLLVLPERTVDTHHILFRKRLCDRKKVDGTDTVIERQIAEVGDGRVVALV